MITIYLETDRAKKLLHLMKTYSYIYEKFPWMARLEKSIKQGNTAHKVRMTETQFYNHAAPFNEKARWDEWAR